MLVIWIVLGVELVREIISDPCVVEERIKLHARLDWPELRQGVLFLPDKIRGRVLVNVTRISRRLHLLLNWKGNPIERMLIAKLLSELRGLILKHCVVLLHFRIFKLQALSYVNHGQVARLHRRPCLSMNLG